MKQKTGNIAFAGTIKQENQFKIKFDTPLPQ